MKTLASFSAFALLATSFAVYACATSDPTNPFGEQAPAGGSSTASNAPTGNGGASSNNNKTSSTSSKGGNSGGDGIDISAARDPDAGVCAAADQPAELTPVYMVFLYDRSGSMGDDASTNRMNAASRWEPMKLGMIDFFTNSGTIGIKASLKYFPAPGDKDMTCHHDYKFPDVPMTSLEKPDALIKSINSQTTSGGTPTLPAVVGGIAYARQLMTKEPGSKAVVVLVTDGEPAIYNSATKQTEIDCAPLTGAGSDLTNTIADITTVVDAAYRGDPQIQTYVIGIGEAQSSMAAIAAAGGTEFIQLDAMEDPEVTREKLTKSLQEIRTKQFECSMPIPKTPDFDQTLVNVSFLHTSGSEEEFRKAPGCSSQTGWEFDDESNPTKIFLCANTCSSVQQDLTGKMQIRLGCPTLML